MKQVIEIVPYLAHLQTTLSAYSKTSPSPTTPREALRTYSSLTTSHEFLPLVPTHTAYSPVELSHDTTLSATSFTPHHPLSDSPSNVTTHCSCPKLCSHLHPHAVASQDSLPTNPSHEMLLSASSSLPYISTNQSLGPARSGHHSSSLSQENVPPSSPLRQCHGSMGSSPMPSLAVGSSERMEGDFALQKGDRAKGPQILKKVHILGTGWTLQVSGNNQQGHKQTTTVEIMETESLFSLLA